MVSAPQQPVAHKRPRVLLVEDEAAVRQHLADALSADYEVDTAGTGTAALHAVMHAKPDLVVTDIVMPEMSGLELLRTLRSVPSTQAIPVLLISGHTEESRRIEGFRHGADGYLAKPYSLQELRAVIHAMVQSARQRSEAARREALEEAERQALLERAELLESITDAFYALDTQWRFTYVNRRALSYYGKTAEELLGKSIWEVFPKAKGTTLQALYERCLREKSSTAIETLSSVTGLWMDLRVYPTRHGLAVYFRDISARKRAEQELLAAQTTLREADRRKDEFIALLSHELRNPLAPIASGLQILQLRAPDDGLVHRTIGMMDRQLKHLVRLVDDLLDINRIRHGMVQLRLSPTSVGKVLCDAIDNARTSIESRHQQLSVTIEAADLIVNSDADRLFQIFSNLLSNASKYTASEGKIAVTLGREGEHAVIAVSDNGIGIAGSALEQIFEMFSGVRPEGANSSAGLGIGLSLVRSLVRLQGGSVHAASPGVGKGSTFTVRLPLLQKPEDHASTAGTAGVLELTSIKKRRVLVVDDNQDAAETLQLLMQMQGYEVHTAADGVQAIEKVRECSPEVIFMDIGMPRMDGIEATRHIRALPNGRDIAIVAITGWGQESDRQRTREAGMTEHLVKPVTPTQLEGVLSRLLGQ
jgi:PAS domain S-box-containing protein